MIKVSLQAWTWVLSAALCSSVVGCDDDDGDGDAGGAGGVVTDAGGGQDAGGAGGFGGAGGGEGGQGGSPGGAGGADAAVGGAGAAGGEGGTGGAGGEGGEGGAVGGGGGAIGGEGGAGGIGGMVGGTGGAGGAGECLSEGETGPVVPDAPQCCEGLAPVGCDAPNAEGACEPCVGAFVCVRCGDGVCGSGENPCNCPDDCGARDTRCDDGTMPLCPMAEPECEALEILAIQGNCYQCVNPNTCRPWGEAGCETSYECAAEDYCNPCGTSSCPACEDCVQACTPHGCPTEPEALCDMIRPECPDGGASVIMNGCWVCVGLDACQPLPPAP